MDEKYYCAVCDNVITLEEQYNCYVCGWDSDPIQEDAPDYRGGANEISLNEARAAWEALQKQARDAATHPLPQKAVV